MEFIRQNISPNKVSIEIIPNDFEESTAMDRLCLQSTIKHDFDKIDNIIEIFRKPSQTINKYTKNLLYTFMTVHDPPSSLLYRANEIHEKVKQFSSLLQSNLDSIIPTMKKTPFTKNEVLLGINTAGEESTKALIEYVAHFLNKSCLVTFANGQFFVVKILQATDACIIDKNEVVVNNISISEFQREITKLKIGKYVSDSLHAKIDKMLLLDIKQIACDLEIELFHTVNGKKKYLLKSELKDSILRKIEQTNTI